MYKDKSKQREANKAAKARYKAKQGIPDAEGIPGIPGIPVQGIPEYPPRWMTPLQWRAWMREHRSDELARLQAEAGTYREYTELPDGQYNRVAKPGDPDYAGVCVKAIWIDLASAKVGDTWQVAVNQVQTQHDSRV